MDLNRRAFFKALTGATSWVVTFPKSVLNLPKAVKKTKPTNIYLALYATMPTATQRGVEVTGDNYTRSPYPVTNFPAAYGWGDVISSGRWPASPTDPKPTHM